MANKPYCRIKRLPPELWAEAAEYAIKVNPANARRPATENAAPEFLIQNTAKRWPRNKIFTVGFLGDVSAALQAKVLEHMNAWAQYGEIVFHEAPPNVADVRISFDQSDGHWSLIGTDIYFTKPPEATMNLALTEQSSDEDFKSAVRHEAGHTIGFEHEHARRSIVERIDRDKAYAYFLQTEKWSKSETDAQVLTPLDDALLMGFPNDIEDVRSIMCYQLPASIMTDGIEVPGGDDIDGFDALVMNSECGDHYTFYLTGVLNDGRTVGPVTDGLIRGDAASKSPIYSFEVAFFSDDDYMNCEYRTVPSGDWVPAGKQTPMWDPLESTCRHASLSIL